jgi:hypothetical protein
MQPLDMAFEEVVVINMAHYFFEAVDHRVHFVWEKNIMESCLAYRWVWRTAVLCRKQSHLYVLACNPQLVVSLSINFLNFAAKDIA